MPPSEFARRTKAKSKEVTMTIEELLEFLKDFPGKLYDPTIKKEK